MALDVGTLLGHYDVTALIGEGGMGQVYQATDTKLNRQVALKILPEAFAADPDRLARFQREAQVLARLNHPGIAAIYGIEEADDTRALVLELVEGPTLADRIAQGPIPVDEALPIAKQIAEALEAAHEAGIIHRDLKPANIKVREDGTVKVLDFGLAKALDTAPEGDPSQSPTMTAAATQMGVIMGTAAYMSPEQASGAAVDKRTDIWSFGVVLFEMLTGRRAFDGETVSHVLAAVLKTQPDWRELPRQTPSGIDKLLHRCLAKARRERIPDIAVARIEIDDAFMPALAQSRMAAPRRALAFAAVAFGAALMTGVAVWSIVGREPDVPRAVARFDITPPSGQRLGPNGEFDVSVAISPDGERVVYVGTRQAERPLFVRELNRTEPTELVGGDARAPFISADGQWVGFIEQGDLRRLPIRGGPPVTITSFPQLLSPRGASWGPDDTIVFGTEAPNGIWQVPASGGEPQELTTLDTGRGEVNHMWPEILPGGGAVAFTVVTGNGIETAQVAVLDLKTGEHSVIVPGGTHPRYAASGHLVYGADSELLAVPFDLERLTASGAPVLVLEDVITKVTGGVDFGLSRNGSLVYISGEVEEPERTLLWIDRQGGEQRLPAEPAAYHAVRFSPNGEQLAVQIESREKNNDVWTYDIEGSLFSRLTTNLGDDMAPIWTPDASRLVFSSTREGGQSNLFWLAADGSGEVERLTTSPDSQVPQFLFSEGRHLAFTQVGSDRAADTSVISIEGDHVVQELLDGPFSEFEAALSPDEDWIAYVSDETGTFEVYVEHFPDLGEKRRVTPNGGREPVWSRDGQELLYRSLDGRQVWSVAVETQPEFRVGAVDLAFEVSTNSRLFGLPRLRVATRFPRSFDIAPDGERFVTIHESLPKDSDGTQELILVQNWLEELTRLVPID